MEENIMRSASPSFQTGKNIPLLGTSIYDLHMNPGSKSSTFWMYNIMCADRITSLAQYLGGWATLDWVLFRLVSIVQCWFILIV